MNYIFRLLLIGCLLPVVCFSQSNNSRRSLLRGDKYYNGLQYKAAIPFYLHIVKSDSVNAHVIEHLATCYRNIKNYAGAEKWFAKLVEVNPQDSQNLLYYAEALANNGKYDLAVKWYAKYHSLNPDDVRGKQFSAAYKSLGDLYADSLDWKLVPIAANSTRAEFSPAYFKGGLVFTSNRNPGSTSKRIFGWDGTPFTDIYEIADTAFIKVDENKSFAHEEMLTATAKGSDSNPDDTPFSSNDSKTLGNISEAPLRIKSDKDDPGNPVKFSKDINSKYHDGPISFAENESWAMFNRNGSSGKNKVNRLKLYSAKYMGGQWFNVEPFPYNNDAYSVGHPALSEDGNILYFISDMPGGKGGTDLYYCLRESQGWSKPVNLGNKVNTAGNEMFPYLDKQGKLYFSSTGLPGLGGLDIFSIDLKDHLPVGEPENLGFPVNSSKDDFGIIMNLSKSSGYLSSNRSGDDDIFRFAFTSVKTKLKGFVFRPAGTRYIPLPGAKAILKTPVKTDTLTADSAGRFYATVDRNKEYQIQVLKEGFIPAGKTIRTTGSGKDMEVEIGLSAPILPVKKALARTAPKEPEESVDLNAIYYDFNKSNIRKDARRVLDKLVSFMKKNKDARVVATSHTDSRGSVSYNLQLSKKRARSVKEYLVSRGIDGKRIITKYYGESALINKCQSGVKCSEHDQQLNRRTEFQIVKGE